ncbi:MAG: hypothetical protein GWO24_12335, partial [Akkermansiaceae bacterium]|nr:hypothetical protein [Akkermansiaceae bacterium]
SAADRLLEAEAVVLAREDPQNPSSLRSLEVLKGDPGKITTDLFLASSSRRSLTLNPRRRIICAYRSGGPEPGWQRIGTADGEFGPLVGEILECAPEWREAPGKRVDFFAPYLGHKDPQINALAHLEVARAPYDQIKRYAGVIPVKDLRDFLKNFRLFEWHALYILLLAQSGEQQDHELIEGKIRSAEGSGTTLQLAAWTTAWIEIAEGKALDFVVGRYLENPGRRPEEIKAVLAALSVQGTRGHTHLRDRIVDAYRATLENHPVMAPQIVTDLVAWDRRDLGGTVAAVVDAPPASLDRTALLQLRAYLRRVGAGEAEATGPAVEGKGSGPGILPLGLALLVLIPVGLGFANRLQRRRGDSLE